MDFSAQMFLETESVCDCPPGGRYLHFIQGQDVNTKDVYRVVRCTNCNRAWKKSMPLNSPLQWRDLPTEEFL